LAIHEEIAEKFMPGYISEVDYDNSGSASDFVEIVVPVGVDVSGYVFLIYDKDGQVTGSFSLGSPVSTVGGNNIYLIDDSVSGFDDIRDDDALALVDDTGTVLQFIAFADPVTAVEGPADGMSATQVGEHSGEGTSLTTSDDGSTYTQTSSTPGTIVCYAPGTMIDTPGGPKPIETLVPNDLVMTLDHGPQPIRWTRSSQHPLEDAKADAKPVLIKMGALGANLPAHDLIVSPQHRILVGGAGQLEQIFLGEAFAPAKSLTKVPGIRHMKGKAKITWIHFACERHEVVIANGCRSESLLLGPMALMGLRAQELRKLCKLYPNGDRQSGLNGSPARPCLSVGDVKNQLAKSRKGKSDPMAKDFRNWDVELAMEQY
jgi:hypothetical protein